MSESSTKFEFHASSPFNSSNSEYFSIFFLQNLYSQKQTTCFHVVTILINIS